MRPLPDTSPIRGIALQVVSGTRHVCSLLSDRTVSCWGKNQVGQLGGGVVDTSDRTWSTPSHRVLTDSVDLAARADRTCAVTAAGLVECWGNLRGHAFDGDQAASCNQCTCARAVPTRVAGVSGARAVAVGMEHACALLRSGHVVCWGDNRFGQLGLGDTRAVPSNGERREVVGLRDVEAIGAGDYSTCARDRRGTVSCWGSNAEGQLGARSQGACGNDGQHLCSPTPVQPLGLPPIQDLAIAPRHACARTAAGRLLCWGANDQRQLGLLGPDTCLRGRYDSCATAPEPGVAAVDTGAIACAVSAHEVPLASPARLAVAGQTATCAFFEDGTYSCWSAEHGRNRTWLKTQSLAGSLDGLVGKPWQVQAITGGSFGGLGAVLFDAGSVQLFNGKSFTPAVISDSPRIATAEPLALGPALVPRCGRASKPIPACAGKEPTAKDVFTYDEAQVGREIQVRAQLGERANNETVGVEAVWRPVLLDRNGHSLAFDLAGDVGFDCNGDCCDLSGIGVKVLASGVVRKAETPNGNQYHLARARLCRLPN